MLRFRNQCGGPRSKRPYEGTVSRWVAAALLAITTATGWADALNLGDIKAQLTYYHDFGGYTRDLEAIDTQATAYLIERAGKVRKPALVLDIDETSLSNWEELAANDFAYFDRVSCTLLPKGSCAAGEQDKLVPCDALPKGPCGAEAFDKLLRASAIAPTLKLAKKAREARVAIFFITGRYEAERSVTETNLKQVGYPQWVQVVMRPNGTTTRSAADFKAPAREQIEKMGYTILVNVGDQPSDLLGGHAERAFLLPNPFYRVP